MLSDEQIAAIEKRHTIAQNGSPGPMWATCCDIPALLADRRALLAHIRMERCPDCHAELSACGEMTADGPSLDCQQCQLRAEIEMLKGEASQLLRFVRHRRDCTINPGGKIMAALGDPNPRPCSCGLGAALKAAGYGE